MADIKEKVNEVLDIGYKILVKLEEPEPDLDKVRALYKQRLTAVEKLDTVSNEEITALKETKKETTKNLITRLQVLEKELNKNLSMLSASKQEALKKLNAHKKAKSSYSKSSAKFNSRTKKIVDLKFQN